MIAKTPQTERSNCRIGAGGTPSDCETHGQENAHKQARSKWRSDPPAKAEERGRGGME